MLVEKVMKWRYFWITVSLFMLFYFGSAVLSGYRATFLTPTVIDQSIPLLSWTVWIYAAEYLMLPIGFIVIRSSENLRQLSCAIILAVLISSVIFGIYPTLMQRPMLPGEGISEQALKLLHWVDPPSNCFPSLHVSIMILIAMYLNRESKAWGLFAWSMALLVSMSTLTTKQHYFVDILGGFMVALIAVGVSNTPWVLKKK